MNLKALIRRAKSGPQAKGQRVRRGEQTKLEEAFLLQGQMLAARDYAEAIIEAVPPLLVLDEKLRVLTANASFCKCFKVSRRQTLNRRIYELGNGQWDIPELRTLMEKVLPRKSVFKNFEVTHEFKGLGRRTMLLSGRQVDHLQKILLFIEDVTEQRKTQAAIRTSEVRYRRLFEAARDGILILDPGTRKITDANPFMSELLGYPRRELLGKELWEIGLLKDEKASQAAFRALRKNRFIRYEDLPLQTKKGRRHEVEFVSNLYDEGGRKVIQCNIRDITERKHSEVALRVSEERFRALFHMGPVAVYSCNASGIIEEFNRRAVRLWGRKPKLGDANQRFCGSLKLFHTDGAPMPHNECPMARVLSGEIPGARDAEVVIERRDGSKITCIANIVPLKDEQGQIIGAINSFYDITQRKRSENALRESESRYRDLFNSMDEGFCIVEMILDNKGQPVDYRFLEVNPGFEKQGGPPNATGKRMRELVPGIEESWFKILGAVALTGRPVRFEEESKALANRWFDVYAFRTGVMAEHKVAMLFTNISERKLSEQALLTAKNEIGRHALDLEQVVAERTSTLRETIGELQGFSYSVSHDMRAPLRAMQSYASFLVDEYGGKLDAQGVDYLHQIMRSAVRLDRLIQDVLSYTRVLHSKLPTESVDLDRLVRDIISTFPNGQPIKPEIHVLGTLPRVIGNEALLAQIVSNLLSNGAKFVSPGTAPLLEISAEGMGGDLVCVWFKDNGIGIAPENHERIFRLFERIHPTAEYEGTGIGLTIVRKAAERMGAEVGFNSHLGMGSRFWIQLKKA
jgi:PAS domain S-box-containing protein